MKRIKLYIMGLLVSLCFSSCGSDFLKEYSQSLGRVQSVDDLNELLMGDCLLPKGYFTVKYSISYENPNYAVLHFMSDELKENLEARSVEPYGSGFRTMMFPYFTWQQNTYTDYQGKNTLESDENTLWELAYNKINNCNVVIDACQQFQASTAPEQERLRTIEGEATFLRAFYYLHLVNLYGQPYSPATASTSPAVPLKISPNVEDKEYQRASVADVYAQIVSDLTTAEGLLKNITQPASIYHVGLEPVYILRSRVALYMQDWQTAADYAQKALDMDGYLFDLKTLGDGEYPLSKANKEVLYSNGSSIFGNMVYESPKKMDEWEEGDYKPVYCVSDELYELFADDDCRKTTYVTTEDDPYDHLPTYHKIDNSTSSFGVYKDVSDVFCIRTAEAYLNLAEADAEMDKDVEACHVLTRLRQHRIDGDATVSLTGAELIQFVRDERERELCFEGHRWFDLRRYSVDEKYPYSKEIVHTFATYESFNGMTGVSSYRLEKNDGAYVLNIPKTVRDFQPSIGSNNRPARPIYKKETPSTDGDDNDD